MLNATAEVQRLLPSAPMPTYTYVPSSSTPHPIRDTQGHSFGRKKTPMKPLTPQSWAECRPYLLGIDYFNSGYYWEAHDEWERLMKSTGVDSLVGRFLKGLIKMAAAGVKVREQSIHGVRRHSASAGEVFADVAAEVNEDTFCGMEFTHLQFAADRAAQLNYRETYEDGVPSRVFPFSLQTELLPLG